MTQLEVLAGLVMFVGLTLLFSLARWFGRQALVDRLRPYTPGGLGVQPRQGLLSVESFRDVIATSVSGHRLGNLTNIWGI